MKSSRAKALKTLLGIDKKADKILQLKSNGNKKVGIISHDGNHRVEDKTTYSYAHGPKMRIYKDLKKAYNKKDAQLTSAILQYFFENKERIGEVEQQLRDRADKEVSDTLEANIKLLSTIPEEQKERLVETFQKTLREYYVADITEISTKELETLIKVTTKEETNNNKQGE